MRATIAMAPRAAGRVRDVSHAARAAARLARGMNWLETERRASLMRSRRALGPAPMSWFLTGLLYMYRYGIMRQSSKSLGTHGVCAKQFCTSISVCPMGDLIPCTCADIQVLQRALVALIRIAHGRRILRFIYAM